MRRRGFTLIEILVVIAILSVIASIAFAGFNQTQYKAEKNRAITYLRAIRASEKMYYGKWKNYIPLTDKSAVNFVLGAEIQAPNYSFEVTAPTSTTFTATATRISNSKTVILDQDANWGGTDTPVPSV